MLRKINENEFVFSSLQSTLHKKWSFSFWIYSVNVTKTGVLCGFGHISKENFNGKLCLLCSDIKGLHSSFWSAIAQTKLHLNSLAMMEMDMNALVVPTCIWILWIFFHCCLINEKISTKKKTIWTKTWTKKCLYWLQKNH